MENKYYIKIIRENVIEHLKSLFTPSLNRPHLKHTYTGK